jgi:hypothetical protein
MGTPQYSPAQQYDPAQPQLPGTTATYARPPEPPPVVISPELLGAYGDPGAELARLLDRLETAKAAVTDAEAERDQIIADIKAQGVRMATALNGGEKIPPHIRFPGTPGRVPWNLDWVIERRFSVTDFQRDEPATYERYRKPKGHWVLGPP